MRSQVTGSLYMFATASRIFLCNYNCSSRMSPPPFFFLSDHSFGALLSLQNAMDDRVETRALPPLRRAETCMEFQLACHVTSVDFRTMLPPVHSTLAELVAWAREARCFRPALRVVDNLVRGARPSPLGDVALLVQPAEASLPRHEAGSGRF